MRKCKATYIGPIIIAGVLLILWETVFRPHSPTPSPTAYPSTIIQAMVEGFTKGSLASHLCATTGACFIALLLASDAAALMAVGLACIRVLFDSVMPIVVGLTVTPLVGFFLIIVGIIFVHSGAEIVATIGTAMVVCFFPILAAVMKERPDSSTNHCSIKAVATDVRQSVPLRSRFSQALPTLLSSARSQTAIALSVVLLVEGKLQDFGLGYFLRISGRLFHYPEIASGIFLASLVGIFIYLFISALERVACRKANTLKSE